MSDLIRREDAVEVIYKALRTPTPDYRKNPFHSSMDLAVSLAKSIPSAQTSLIEAVKIIEDFLHGCHDSLTSEIVTTDGIKLHTDWGYFEEGLEEIRRYAERRA